MPKAPAEDHFARCPRCNRVHVVSHASGVGCCPCGVTWAIYGGAGYVWDQRTGTPERKK